MSPSVVDWRRRAGTAGRGAIVAACAGGMAWMACAVASPLHAAATLSLAAGTIGVALVATRRAAARPRPDLVTILVRSLAARGVPAHLARDGGDPPATPRAHLLRAGVSVADRGSVRAYAVSTLGGRLADMGGPDGWPPYLRLATACILSDPSTPSGAAVWSAAARLGHESSDLPMASSDAAGSRGIGVPPVPGRPAPAALRLAEAAVRVEAVAGPVLAAYADTLAALAGRHAFANTAMMGLLAEVRAGRRVVLQNMAWLRACDRDLWHALNDMGRPSVHVQALGPAEHHRSEVGAGHALAEPSVTATVDRLTAKPVPRAGDPPRAA